MAPPNPTMLEDSTNVDHVVVPPQKKLKISSAGNDAPNGGALRSCVVRPFKALRPVPSKVEEVACVPYDVINSDEARSLSAGKPSSFLHVIRPEINFPVGKSEYADDVYAKGAEVLASLDKNDDYVLDDSESLYVYRLIMDGRSQTGVFGCVSVAQYDDNTILKHELTRQKKEDDRVRHIQTQSAHAEPIMLTYRGEDSVNQIVSATQEGEALYDFTAADGVQHTVWKTEKSVALSEAFAKVQNLYVADGHHRCKAASRTAESMRELNGDKHTGEEEYNFFPAVLFPVEEMYIMPYNRVVFKLPATQEDFLSTLRSKFTITETTSHSPAVAGTVSVYLGSTVGWHTLELPKAGSASATVCDDLDVARLQEHVLTPILNIQDVRTDTNIDFIGGIRGTEELVRLVDSSKAQVAFSMYSTQIMELLGVSDAGLLMPPKSTWFEPKLRSGLLVHKF